MPMKNPVHPGSLVLHDCIEPLNLTVTRAAGILGVTRQALNNLIHEKSGMSAEMAIRLEQAFGGSAAAWLQMQLNYDLAKARQHEVTKKVKRKAPELAMHAATKRARISKNGSYSPIHARTAQKMPKPTDGESRTQKQ